MAKKHGLDTITRFLYFPEPAEPVNGAEIVVHSGPVEFFEGKTLELHCDLTAGNHVSYKWLLNGQLVSPSRLHYVADGRLLINRSVESHLGGVWAAASALLGGCYGVVSC